MTREEMMDEMINTFGFERKWTVWFCKIAENKKLPMFLVIRAFALAQVLSEAEN